MRKAFFAERSEEERAQSERQKNAMSRSRRPSGAEDESLPTLSADRQAAGRQSGEFSFWLSHNESGVL